MNDLPAVHRQRHRDRLDLRARGDGPGPDLQDIGHLQLRPRGDRHGGAYFFYYLHVDHGWDWVPRSSSPSASPGRCSAWLMEPIARAAVAAADRAAKIVGTIGLILLVQGLATIKYGVDTDPGAAVPAAGARALPALGGVNISYPQLIVTLCRRWSPSGVLYATVPVRPDGLAMRAVVDDPDLVAMQAHQPAAGPARLVDHRLHVRGRCRACWCCRSSASTRSR